MSALARYPRLYAWYRAARPRTLTATYAPLGVAAVVALDQGVFDLLRFVLSLIGALFLQIASNLINEYADYARGSDMLKVAGQGMVIKQDVLAPRAVLAGAILTVLAGSLIGLLLLVYSGLLLLWIGLGGVLVVILYTAGPLPLAYLGLGELAVFIFMGPLMVLGAYYVMAAGQTSNVALLAGLPIGFMVAAILHANNIRDMDADRAANKRTLAVRFGLRFARGEYVFLVGGAYVALAVLVIGGVMPWSTLLAFVTAPEAYRLITIITTRTDTALLHQAQGRTAKLHGQFGLWLAVGWLAAFVLRAIMGA
ncbi:MAG: 1,4-dihydroxy-2-naphthoate octaprenyltransferase [Anaerolineae bacterium]|nr:1,4-dihydroxy-2-naphthoate octaprenyltransferase [Anaerolineae bacterium]